MRVLGYTLSELARLQIELEYALTREGLLVPREGSSERNRCSLYVHAAGLDAYFRSDVPAAIRQSVLELGRNAISTMPQMLLERVRGTDLARSETYVATELSPGSSCRDARLVDGTAVVTEADGRAVSWAWSVRESDRAAECAVETAESFRRRGFAYQAAAAWVNGVLATGKVPFYSCDEDNDASRALAERLGLTYVFTVFAIA